MTWGQFVDAVARERCRQREIHPGCQELPDSSDNPEARRTFEGIARHSCDRAAAEGRLTHSHVFEEEVAEVLTAAASGDEEGLEEELIQVAAVCGGWVEDINRRRLARAGRGGKR